MDRAKLSWSDYTVRLSEVAKSSHPMLRNKKGFYALLSAKLDAEADLWRDIGLLHIGHTSGQSLRARITQSQPAHDRAAELVAATEGAEIIVLLGEVASTSLGRDTKDFLQDIESCLVKSNRPAAHPDPDAAAANRDISVVNGERKGTDYRPLKWRSLYKVG